MLQPRLSDLPLAVTVRVRSGEGREHAAPTAARLYAMHATVRAARERCAGLEVSECACRDDSTAYGLAV